MSVETPPNLVQKKICWAALTSVSSLAIVASLVFTVYVLVLLMGFLQPVLLPLAVAGVLAYLLEPFVAFLCRKGCNRTWGTLIVFLAFFLTATGVLLSVVPTAYRQGAFFFQNFPAYSQRFQELGIRTLQEVQQWQSSLQALDPFHDPSAAPLPDATPGASEGSAMPGTAPAAGATTTTSEAVDAPPPLDLSGHVPSLPGRDFIAAQAATMLTDSMKWLQDHLPDMALYLGRLLQRSLGGFMGAFGLIIGFILVPIFLFYLLRDAPRIKEGWVDFIPLPQSALKQEVVSLILEINGYVIAFFRGQILVAVIDGAIIAVALLFMGLEYAVLIGLLVAALGIIPYAGTILTWGPATLIAAVQFGDWFHPLLVTLIFIGVNQLDSLFITPYVLGESVGLHSLTVMIAVLAWTVIIGGLLGALLAVPLTAALKVVGRRYLWMRPAESGSPPGSPPGAG